MSLSDERAVPSPRRLTRLSDAEVSVLLGQLHVDWKLVEGHLVRSFAFPDFKSALELVNRVGAVAEAEGHHPNVSLGWGRVELEFWTHDAGGLTRADFVLAAKCDRLREGAR